MAPTILQRVLATVLMLCSTNAHIAVFNATVPRWEANTTGGPLICGDRGAYLNLTCGVDLWYTTCGLPSFKPPVLILHGGMGNSNQMYHQANMLARTRQVILQDTRGQGRSPYAGFTGFHYDDFTRDAIAVLDHLNIPKVSVVGWSDGAITALDLAMNYTSRIERVFAHGANLQANMSLPGLNDPVINSKDGSMDSKYPSGVTYSTHSRRDIPPSKPSDPYTCENLSPLPQQCHAMKKGVKLMWNSEPTWNTTAMKQVTCPTWIVDGDHDTAVQRNQIDTMAAWIPFAGQLILPQVGHEALLQDPKFFNFAVEYFLDMDFEGVMPGY